MLLLLLAACRCLLEHPLAVLHQLTGALLVIATAWCAHAIGRAPQARA
jgi:hypothetical protein